MATHALQTPQMGVKVYFCEPHSPRQRGTCEDTHGLLRQSMHKRTDPMVYSRDQLDAIADQINRRPPASAMTFTCRCLSIRTFSKPNLKQNRLSTIDQLRVLQFGFEAALLKTIS